MVDARFSPYPYFSSPPQRRFLDLIGYLQILIHLTFSPIFDSTRNSCSLHAKVLYYRAAPQRGSHVPGKHLRCPAVFATSVDSSKDDPLVTIAIGHLQRLEQQFQ